MKSTFCTININSLKNKTSKPKANTNKSGCMWGLVGAQIGERMRLEEN